MANIITQEDDQNQQENQQQSPNLTQTGGVQGSPTARTATSQPARSEKPQGSGRFTNLQRYLKANQPASQQLTSGIREKGQDYMSQVRQGVESAQGVQQGIQSEQQRLGQAGQLAQGIRDDAVNIAQQNLQDVTQLRLGQNQANQLAAQGQQARQDIMGSLDPLQQFGQNLGTEQGRFNVLQDVYGGAYRPGYSTGQRRLDQLFLQAGGDNQLSQLQQDIGQTVSSADRSLLDLQSGLGSGLGDIRSGAQQAQQDILGAIGSFTGDEAGALGQLYQDFGTAQSTREAQLESNRQRAINELRSGNLSPEVANMLGITSPMDVSDLDLAKYAQENIQLGDTDVTMADVAATGDLQDRLNALAQLSGKEISEYDLGEQAGSDIGFDTGAFEEAAKEARTTYEDRFFDKDFWDVVGGTPTAGYEDWTILDELASASNAGYITGVNEGQTVGFAPLPYTSLLDDYTSRSQLEKTLADATAKESAGWIPAAGMTDQWQKILDMFDASRYRTLGIGDSSEEPTYGAF